MGASRSRAPRSTSCMTARSVNSLDTEPTRYTVSALAGAFVCGSAKPKPRAQTMRWSSTNAIDTAGSPLTSASWRMNFSSSRATAS